MCKEKVAELHTSTVTLLETEFSKMQRQHLQISQYCQQSHLGRLQWFKILKMSLISISYRTVPLGN